MLRIVTKSGRVLLKSACTLINNELYEVGNRNNLKVVKYIKLEQSLILLMNYTGTLIRKDITDLLKI